MHYVPAWVKNDAKRFPHTIRPDGEPIDVLSPHSRNTLEADKAAFVALTRHLKQLDGEAHTVLAIQVENESGNIGSVRDNSAESNREFAGPVPADLLAAAHKQPGTWAQVFGAEADEIFQAYHQAKYINEIAAAGKREFNIPYSSTCGSITRPRRCRSGSWTRPASAIRAEARCKSWWASGARLRPRST